MLISVSETEKTTGTSPSKSSTPSSLGEARKLIAEMRRLMMVYEFGMEEILTKIKILRGEFHRCHNYNPIEHVGSRLKSPQSMVRKAQRKGIPLEYEALRQNMFDIAGIRLTCSFVSDIYRMRELLLAQTDLTLLDESDYIKNPKPNGYQSLHMILEVPVFLAESVEHIPVEVQLRTIAMDFWASLEHKIYYKYDKEVPRHLTDALKLSADMAATLDTSMERIHNEVLELDRELRESEEFAEEEVADSNDLFAAIFETFESRESDDPS